MITGTYRFQTAYRMYSQHAVCRVACNGTESGLAQCTRWGNRGSLKWGNHSCSHWEDAGVTCFNCPSDRCPRQNTLRLAANRTLQAASGAIWTEGR